LAARALLFPALTALSLLSPFSSFLPHVGRVTIIMNDYPLVKYALIGVLGLFVVTSKE
jgi:signal peptidase